MRAFVSLVVALVSSASAAGPFWCVLLESKDVDGHRVRSAMMRAMIRKLKSGKYRLYSRKKDSRTGKRKNLGTFKSKAAAKKHERAVQYFKRN